MRILVAILAIVALVAGTFSAQAQKRGKRPQQAVESSEAQAKKKAEEKAYQDALKRIPEPTEKRDPWKNVR